MIGLDRWAPPILAFDVIFPDDVLLYIGGRSSMEMRGNTKSTIPSAAYYTLALPTLVLLHRHVIKRGT